MTWGEIGNDGQKIGGDSAIIVYFNQGNRILLSESEYRSQILQVPARSLPLLRHTYFQRLFSFLTAYLHYALRGEIGKLGGAGLVRIRICGIIGFSGFYRRPSVFGLAGFTVMAKSAIRTSEIL